ncbi:MAG: hypothetical protein WDZ69_02780 [Candidatus Pacearchaeota archaeon]
MAKREVGKFLPAGILVLGALAVAYFVSVSFTGFAVFEPSNDIAGENATFSYYVENFTNANLHPNGQYIFSTNNTGTWINDSAENFTATPDWANETKTLNNTVGSVIGYRWYLTDNSSNSSATKIFTLTTTPDVIAPKFKKIPEDASISYGKSLSVDFDAEDNVGLDSYFIINWTDTFEINSSTGILTNSSVLSVGTNYVINVSVNDTSENTNSTLFSVNVTEAEPDLSLTGTSQIKPNATGDVEGTGCPGQLNCTLYRDGEAVDNPDNSNFEKEGNYTYVYKTTGNENYSSASSESFELVVRVEENTDGDGGETGNEEGESSEAGQETESFESSESESQTQSGPLNAESIGEVRIRPGSLEEVSLNVENTGSSFMMSCELSSSGENSDWISFDEGQKNIDPDEEAAFNFVVSVSEDTGEGEYPLSVSVECSSGDSVSESFTVLVEKEKIGFEIVDARKTRQDDMVRVTYSLEELSGTPQDVEIDFVLEDSNETQLANLGENRSLDSNESSEFTAEIIVVNGSLEDEVNLRVSYNSEIYSSSVRESLVLGAPIGGFAIFDELGLTGIGANAIIVIAGAFLLLIVIFFITRRIRLSMKARKKSKSTGDDSSPKKEKKEDDKDSDEESK